MILIENVKVESDNILEVFKKLKLNFLDFKEYKIIKKSLDVRNKNNPCFVFSIAIEADASLISKNYKTKLYEEKKYFISKNINKTKISKQPIIIGAGPAGLFCSLILSENGFSPIIVEQGKMIEERHADIAKLTSKRIFNQRSNYLFGEGGAGAYSDGKLTCRINDNTRIKKIVDTFISCGAPSEIAFSNKPHIGSDILFKVLKNFRTSLLKNGVSFNFSKKLENLIIIDGKLNSAIIDKNEIPTDILILACGHSARDLYRNLDSLNISMEFKPFSVGLRIEHLQDMINSAQYGKTYKSLPSADYFLVNHGKSGTLYTFCMCPGGYVIPSMGSNNSICTNGMSNYSRDAKNSNSALLVPVNSSNLNISSALSGLKFQEKLESLAFIEGGSNYNAPVQTLGDFFKGITSSKTYCITPSYKPGFTLCDLNKFLPTFILNSMKENIKIFANKIKNFDDPHAILTGVETGSSAPVRILRNENFESINTKGLYPCGEGSGYAGGIISSAIEGIKVAEKIVKNYYI